MFIIRPVKASDLDDLERFANGTALGMLSLPRDRSMLQERIAVSMASFKKEVLSPSEEMYLFVLEDAESGKARGSCGIYAKTGFGRPLYFFTVESLSPRQNGLPLPDEIKILHPTIETNGPSEMCALFLDRDLRHAQLGELLSRSRYLFIAQHLRRFDDTIVARLRGFINNTKQTSPFWEGLGRRFLDMEFVQVMRLLQDKNNFIPEFMPRYPIYVSLLPKQTQYVIQKTHVSTRPALKMLKKEGFVLTNQVDIFDAGPVVGARTVAIRSVENNTQAVVEGISENPLSSPSFIISNTSLDFRACYGRLKLTSYRSAIISKEVAKALQVKAGDKIRFIARHTK